MTLSYILVGCDFTAAWVSHLIVPPGMLRLYTVGNIDYTSASQEQWKKLETDQGFGSWLPNESTLFCLLPLPLKVACCKMLYSVTPASSH